MPLASIRQRLTPIGNAMSKGDGGWVDAVAARARRPLDRMFLRRVGALDGLAELGRSVTAAAPPATGPRVLMCSLRAWPDHLAFESVIVHALRMRGAHVTVLNCGGGMPVCELGRARLALPRPCDRCAWHTDRALAATGAPQRRLREELPWGADPRRAPLAAGTGQPGGAQAGDPEISLAWYLRTSDPATVPGSVDVARDFAVTAEGVFAAAQRLLDEERPDVVFSVNGLFAAEGAIRAAALARGIRCPTYEISARAGALVLSQDTPAPEYDNDAAWAAVGDRPLGPGQRQALDRLLADRARGVGAHETYFDAPEERVSVLRSELGIQAGARVVSLFTNVMWDSGILGKDVGFGSMLDWLHSSIDAVARRPADVLVIRVHPAEEHWETRERVGDVLAAEQLPPNVRVVAADRPLSSYALLELSELVLAYTTTVGLEAATRGLRVAVAGATHYRGRGFTLDVDGPDDLERALDSSPGRLSEHELELARRYAFTFFFRTTVPIRALEVAGGRVRDVPRDAAAVAPGADPHLDFIADRLLDGGPMVLPDDLAIR